MRRRDAVCLKVGSVDQGSRTGAPCREPATGSENPRPPGTGPRDPGEELRQAVDLVVVATMGELQDLGLEVLEPGGALRQENVPGLDLGRLGGHAGHLVAFGLNGDRADLAVVLQVLDQVGCAS